MTNSAWMQKPRRLVYHARHNIGRGVQGGGGRWHPPPLTTGPLGDLWGGALSTTNILTTRIKLSPLLGQKKNNFFRAMSDKKNFVSDDILFLSVLAVKIWF